MTPLAWLGGAATLSAALFGVGLYVAVSHNAEVKSARKEGVAIGTGEAATKTLVVATKAAEAAREAETEVPLDADREYYKKLCGKHASCKSRSKYK